MRRLLGVILLAATAYGAYWGAARLALGHALDQIPASAAAQGVEMSFGEQQVSGFPSRLDVTLRDVNVANAQFQYHTDFAQVFALAYRPTHVIGFAPGPHILKTDQGDLVLTTQDLRASVRAKPRPSLPLSEARLIAERAELTSPFGTVTLNELRGALRSTQTPLRYEFALVLDRLARPGQPGAHLDQITMGGFMTLDAPLSRETQTVSAQQIELSRATLTRGDSAIEASGLIDIIQDRGAQGVISVSLRNWAPLIDELAADLPQVNLLRGGLSAVTGPDGTAQVTLRIIDSQVFFGPFAIAQLPL